MQFYVFILHSFILETCNGVKVLYIYALDPCKSLLNTQDHLIMCTNLTEANIFPC